MRRLLNDGHTVVGIDNLDPYYDVALKEARLAKLADYAGFQQLHADIADMKAIGDIFNEHRFQYVVHLAAQAGVRNSIDNPHDYVDSNVTGTLNVLEGCRAVGTEHLVYASTSSVYGASTDLPFSTLGDAEHPLAIYAATKRSAELMAHSYAHLHGVASTGLRFFTVYGPWGRPDMALFLFTQKMLANEPIPVFNHGHHRRDFTYIDDIVEGIVRIIFAPAEPSQEWNSGAPRRDISSAPWRVYNIGNGNPVPLLNYIEELERCLGIDSNKNMLPIQPGDVESTHADVDGLFEAVGYRPQTSIAEGVLEFVEWYRTYYGTR